MSRKKNFFLRFRNFFSIPNKLSSFHLDKHSLISFGQTFSHFILHLPHFNCLFFCDQGPEGRVGAVEQRVGRLRGQLQPPHRAVLLPGRHNHHTVEDYEVETGGNVQSWALAVNFKFSNMKMIFFASSIKENLTGGVLGLEVTLWTVLQKRKLPKYLALW